jgi:hypothetical protein
VRSNARSCPRSEDGIPTVIAVSRGCHTARLRGRHERVSASASHPRSCQDGEGSVQHLPRPRGHARRNRGIPRLAASGSWRRCACERFPIALAGQWRSDQHRADRHTLMKTAHVEPGASIPPSTEANHPTACPWCGRNCIRGTVPTPDGNQWYRCAACATTFYIRPMPHRQDRDTEAKLR